MHFLKNLFVDSVSSFQLFGVIRYALLLLTAISLAHSNMDLASIGMYESMLMFTGMVSFFYTGAITTRLLTGNPESRIQEYKSAFFLLFMISCLAGAAAFILSGPIARNLNIPDQNYIKLFALYIIIYTPGFLLEYIFLIEKKIKQLLVYVFIYGGAYLMIISWLAWTSQPVESIFNAIILLALARFLFTAYRVFGVKPGSFGLKNIRVYLLSVIPLMLSLFLSGCADYIDSILVSKYFGPEDLAIFRYGAKEFPLSLLLANSLSNAIVPVLSHSADLKEGLQMLRKKGETLMHIVFPVSILLMLTGKWIYPLVFTDRFNDSVAIFNIYLLLVCSRVLFPQTVLIAKGHFKTIASVSAIELFINIAASITLMNFFGLAGIAMGTFIAFISEKIILVFLIYKKENITLNEIISWKPFALYSAMILLSFLFGYFK